MSEKVKCACEHCECMIESGSAIEKDGKLYCHESCADGHATQASCGHTGCSCSCS